MFDMFVGGAVQRMSIFALGVMPYISASIIISAIIAQILSDQADYLNTTYTTIADYIVYFSVFTN